MVIRTDTTVEKLLRSFMQFRKAGWHEHSVASCTPSEIKVLFCLGRGMKQNNSIITVSEISKILRVTSPTVTQILKKLEANGFVERHADDIDRRVVRITLTDKGQDVVHQAKEEFRASINGLIEYLGEEQSNQLADLLSRVSHYYHDKAANEQYMDWSQEPSPLSGEGL